MYQVYFFLFQRGGLFLFVKNAVAVAVVAISFTSVYSLNIQILRTPSPIRTIKVKKQQDFLNSNNFLNSSSYLFTILDICVFQILKLAQ